MTIWVLYPDAVQTPVTAAERLPAVTVLEDGAIAVHSDLSEEQRAWMRRRLVGIAMQARWNR
jgi:hypothetical protein